MLKSILFDLDDTLINWGDFDGEWERIETPHITRVYEHMAGLGELAVDFSGYKHAYFERTKAVWAEARETLQSPHLGRVLLDVAMQVGLTRDQADMQALLDAYGWGIIDGTTLFPEVHDVLTTLRDSGLKLGVLTNAFAPMWMRDIELADHGLLEFFPSCRVSAADTGYLKPHPEVFRIALDMLDTTPEETIFVGDNPTADIAGAQAVGMQAVMRVSSSPQPMISGLVIPDAAVNNLHELMPILDEWFPGWQARV